MFDFDVVTGPTQPPQSQAKECPFPDPRTGEPPTTAAPPARTEETAKRA